MFLPRFLLVVAMFLNVAAHAAPIPEEVLRKVFTTGPGRWVATGNNPAGKNHIVRGLSGVGWAKGSAASEWEPFVRGEAGAQDRFVGVGQDPKDIPRIINNIAGFYANPFIVSGRVDDSRLTKDIDPNVFDENHGAWATTSEKQIIKKGYTTNDFDKIGVLMPTNSFEYRMWVKGYQEAAQKYPPEKGSRGEEFLNVLKVELHV